MAKRLHLILRSHHTALKMLNKSKGSNFDIILNNTPSMIKAIRILFRYILKNTLKMERKHLSILKPHRKFIRKIANGSNKIVKPVIQKGGSIFNTILSTVLPLLAAII